MRQAVLPACRKPLHPALQPLSLQF